MRDNLSIEVAACFKRVNWRMNRAGVQRRVRAFLRDSGETGLVSAKQLHHAHHAMMLAMSPAAWWKVRIGVRAKYGRDQRQAEDRHQDKCNRAAHFQRIV
jgi:hypothetical protein